MILHILYARPVGGTLVSVAFDDGHEATVDLEPLLRGSVFEPLRDPERFAELYVDPVCRTICWPGDIDLAPEAVRALASVATPLPG